jgi:hypothetical protein
MTIFSRLFSLCPRIRKVDDRLFARTGWRVIILSLGLLYRSVTVDPTREQVTIYRRYFWFFARRRQIPFKKVEAVAYGYKDLGIGSSVSWGYKSADVFSVGLRLFGGEEVHLFYFFGEGQLTTKARCRTGCTGIITFSMWAEPRTANPAFLSI